MEFNNPFLTQQSSSKDPFEALSELCTMLFLAEDQLVPIGSIGMTVLGILKKSGNSGDIIVMAARTLALILDKFSAIIILLPQNQKKGAFSTKSLSKALEKVFVFMTSPNMTLLRFEKSSKEELTEELLRCLTLTISATDDVRASAPSARTQLEFCASVLSSSKRLTCKVLHHCCTLARGGYLVNNQNRELYGSMLTETLAALEVLDIDVEWDELLRAVTEGIVTMRSWCGALMSVGAAKRTRAGGPLERTDLREFLSRKDATRLYLKLCSRICVDFSVNERRIQLVLACTNAVSSAHDLSSLTTLSDWDTSIALMMETLQQTTRGTLKVSDPFARQKKSGDNTFEEDTLKLLPNLQWELPNLYWTALILMAKLCNMELDLDEKYAWAWRGDNDNFYWYRPKESAALTKGFFSAQRKVILNRSGHTVNLSNMTDFRIHTNAITRVHFQCIPCSYRYKNSPLKNVGKLSTERLLQYDKFSDLKKTLRTSSFGSTEAAQLCKIIYLHVVCHDGPSNSEDAKHAFRSLVTQQPLSVLEEFSSKLLSRDAMWAPILLESGIADALTKPLVESSVVRRRSRHEVADRQHEAQRLSLHTHSQVAHGTVHPPHFKTSPIAEAIRETSSKVSQPQLVITDVPLPCSMTSIIEFMKSASYREFVSWLKSSNHPATDLGVLDESVYPIIEKWFNENPQERVRVGVMLATYTSQELQQLALEGMKHELLTEIAGVKPVALPICAPAQPNKCSNGHTMHIHFSSNWLCDQCGKTTAYGALSCRLCDYDLCYQCGEVMTGCVKANSTATAADVLSSWNRTLANVKHSFNDKATSTPLATKSDAPKLLYTQSCVLSMSTPVNSLVHLEEGIHAGVTYATCRCEVSVPNFYVRTHFHGNGESISKQGGTPNNTYWRLLSMCGEEVSQDPSVTHAMVEAVESYATAIFLNGLEGLPRQLCVIMTHLAPFLSLPLKNEIARFLSVDCRRYALYHIQESHIGLSGTIQGDINSNGLPYKLTVVRGDLDNIVKKFSKFFIEECPSLRNKLEVQFEGEEGTGTGPTREFFAELSELYRKAKYLWYEQDEGGVLGFPSCKALYLKDFYVLGVALSRAFVDGFTMDVPLLPQVWSLHRARNYQETTSVLRSLLEFLEPALISSYDYLLKATKEEIDAMELCDENDQRVTIETAHLYVSRRVTRHFEIGCENLHAMAVGLLSSVDLASFWFLSDQELSALLCCNAHEKESGKLFTESQLRAVVTEAHGYSVGAKEVEMFVSIVGSEFDELQQRLFLEFLTGSAHLPLNGLAGLERKITVVKKPFEGKGEQMLPSCNTCFLYFKLPPYTSREIMRQRLLFAITEGRRNFSLS